MLHWRSVISFITKSVSLPSSAFDERKSGKKRSFITTRTMTNFNRIITQRVRPNVMLRNPSTYKSATLRKMFMALMVSCWFFDTQAAFSLAKVLVIYEIVFLIAKLV